MNSEEKALVKVNKNSILYKIKKFFSNLFKSKDINNVSYYKENREEETGIKSKDEFIESVKTIENDDTKILKLQEKYRKGEIKEEEMTEEEIAAVCALYDKQISSLKKSLELRKEKLLQYRKNMLKNN